MKKEITLSSSAPSQPSAKKKTLPRYSELFSASFNAPKRVAIELAVTRLATATNAAMSDQRLECYAEDLEEFEGVDLALAFREAQQESDLMPTIRQLRHATEELERLRTNREAMATDQARWDAEEAG